MNIQANNKNIEVEVPEGYKKTEVGVIPKEWKIQKLGDLTDIYDGTHQTPKYVDVGVPFYSVEHVSSNDFTNTKFISEEVFEKESERVVLEKGDVLMTRIGDVGTAKLIDWNVRASFYVSLALIKQCKELNSKFLEDSINGQLFQKELFKKIIHVAFPKKINLGDIRKLLIPIPPLPEQKAIADCLSTWDKGIEKLSALIASKKEQKKGLMQQLLTGKKRLDGFTEEWKTKRLNVIGKVNYGTRIVKGNVEEGEYFVYGGGGKTFTNKEYNREDRMIIARFAMSKECARFVKGKFYLNDSGLTVDANEKTNQSFLDYLLFFNQHNIYKLRAGGAQQNLDVQAFRGISLSIPAINEQIAIADILNTSDKEIELLENKLEFFKTQKKGLMQVLLTGEKRLV